MAVKQRQYLIYVIYLLSIGFYQMSTDGIAYQYLWPHSPHWNEYAFEVISKSEKIYQQVHTIEEQNKELLSINQLLQSQAAEISRMNVLLANDNIKLKRNIERVTAARILSTELSFEEFNINYPDQDACYKFLADLKWSAGQFHCVKCHHTAYKKGKTLYRRRCTKCNYEESVLYNTIFENNRIPINKAFYLVYLIYTSKGSISSY
ncbi:7TM diverse intracellular signaling domain-containing protein [Mucilaginibacter koreensis]